MNQMVRVQRIRDLPLRRIIISDLARYRVLHRRSYACLIIICPGIMASVYYRIGHQLWKTTETDGAFRTLLKGLYLVVNRFVESFTGISLAPRAEIGPGLHISHFGGIVVGDDVVMGSNCNLAQDVTIGVAGRVERGSPRIGDRVYFGPGAKAFGKITIGHDVAIGANAVVTRSVPDRAVVGGVPARIISFEGSFEFVLYDGMDDDLERSLSLALREAGRTRPATGTGQ